ncbi:Oidioi.mRNA.OKI2018_I69.XSR.g14391.t1.cds [Oikopleura dioica]|uniref:Oidioi.mRNA.OKI2018_I69.XSR.g14391.t1.cds n=1 Tax=Oikopleura dioica TaxID=34765 RepID=A0ABN7S9N0_OIKDI|nr:Oidioi.mRNA.OKI2018_I69.XSR.g14391.t1.cds [Oikopleura dioica]
MPRIYLKNFPQSAGEQEIRQFFRKYSADIEGVNLVEKKNEDVVISRFAFLQIRDDCANLQRLLKENGKEWDGARIEVKQAKESFRERAAKLRQEKKEVENKENFQAPFQAAKFEKSDSDDSSSSSDDDDESIEEQKEQKKRKLAEASKLLQAKLSQRKKHIFFCELYEKESAKAKTHGDDRRKDALSEREARFQRMKMAKPSGTKVRFDSSDEDEETGKGRDLLDGSGSEEEMEPDFSSKMRPEFGDASGAGLFQMEQNFNDERFKLDEHFKDDERLQEKVSRQKQQELRARRKREFQNTVYNPYASDDESENEENAFDQNQFTNLKAPEISAETHFGVKKLNIGVEESETGEQAAGGFSLLSMFNRPEGQDEDASAEDGDQMDDGVSTVRKAPPQITKVLLGGEREEVDFNFWQTYDLKKFKVDKAKVIEERRALRQKSKQDYYNIARRHKVTKLGHDALLEKLFQWW